MDKTSRGENSPEGWPGFTPVNRRGQILICLLEAGPSIQASHFLVLTRPSWLGVSVLKQPSSIIILRQIIGNRPRTLTWNICQPGFPVLEVCYELREVEVNLYIQNTDPLSDKLEVRITWLSFLGCPALCPAPLYSTISAPIHSLWMSKGLQDRKMEFGASWGVGTQM